MQTKIQEIYLQHIQTTCTAQYQKTNHPIKKIEGLNAHFSKEGIDMAIKHIKISVTAAPGEEENKSGQGRYLKK